MNSQGGGQFNGHVTEVGSLMEREWSFYGGGQQWREKGHVRGSQCNLGRIVVIDLASLKN